MFIAHLPATWLAFRALAPRDLAPAALVAGLAGGLAPDLDLLWFMFIDNGHRHHHTYPTHRPAVWAGLLLSVLLSRCRSTLAGTMAIAFCAGALVHLGLDTLTGRIAWAWPLSDHAVPLVDVPATRDHWIASFLVHWTFRLELALTAVGLLTWRLSPHRQKEKPGNRFPGSSIS